MYYNLSDFKDIYLSRIEFYITEVSIYNVIMFLNILTLLFSQTSIWRIIFRSMELLAEYNKFTSFSLSYPIMRLYNLLFHESRGARFV